MFIAKLQNGQAMVEFVITATFLLLPLFLMIPLLGKYIEIQQYSVEAARYEAWEYTVWFNADADVPKSFNKSNNIPGLEEAVKSVAEVRNESRKRFFSDTELLLTNEDKITGWEESTSNPFMQDYQGKQLYDGAVDGSLDYNQATPDLTSNLVGGKGVVNTLVDVVEAVPAFLIKVLSFGTLDPGFTVLNSGGYMKSKTELLVIDAPNYGNTNISEPLFIRNLELKFNANAAVLTEGWNAGGRLHAKTEAEGLVPTILLREPFDFVVDILSYIPFIPASELQSLEWGHTDSEAIPPEYLDDDGETECDDHGYCNY